MSAILRVHMLTFTLQCSDDFKVWQHLQYHHTALQICCSEPVKNFENCLIFDKVIKSDGLLFTDHQVQWHQINVENTTHLQHKNDHLQCFDTVEWHHDEQSDHKNAAREIFNTYLAQENLQNACVITVVCYLTDKLKIPNSETIIAQN